jgi:hypothetical protein
MADLNTLANQGSLQQPAVGRPAADCSCIWARRWQIGAGGNDYLVGHEYLCRVQDGYYRQYIRSVENKDVAGSYQMGGGIGNLPSGLVGTLGNIAHISGTGTRYKVAGGRDEAFQGLHNEGKRVVLVFDEASAIDDKIWEVAEGAFTDANTEKLWLAFGNPTRPKGRFFEAIQGKFKHRWHPIQLDSRTVEGINQEQIQNLVSDYGEDSDFVRVRVRGEFPRAGSNQFIASDVVAACRKHRAESSSGLPRIMGVDVARFGDDQTVIFMRQGRKAECLAKYRGLDTAQVTAQVINFIDQHKPDGVVVDSDGIGAPVFDQLKFRGYGKYLHEFHGGKPASDYKAYFNRRAEIWGLMRDWLNADAQIPDEPELEADLTGPLYGFSAQQQVQLEKKDDMKKRGLSSPDMGDALAMTFAVQMQKAFNRGFRGNARGETVRSSSPRCIQRGGMGKAHWQRRGFGHAA